MNFPDFLYYHWAIPFNKRAPPGHMLQINDPWGIPCHEMSTPEEFHAMNVYTWGIPRHKMSTPEEFDAMKCLTFCFAVIVPVINIEFTATNRQILNYLHFRQRTSLQKTYNFHECLSNSLFLCIYTLRKHVSIKVRMGFKIARKMFEIFHF